MSDLPNTPRPDEKLVLVPERLRQEPERLTLAELQLAITSIIIATPGAADRPVVIRAFPDATGDALSYDLAIDVTDVDAWAYSTTTYALGLRLGRA